MGQKKNLFTPDQILYQGSSHRPASPQPPTDRPDLWPVFLFLFFLTLIAVLAWVGQIGH